MEANQTDMITYSVVVPVYNSSQTLGILNEQIQTAMDSINAIYEVVYVDDGSLDDSWEVLKKLGQKDEKITIIRLANNFGQWSATLCGIENTKGKFVVTIDDDLQYAAKDIKKLIEYRQQKDLLLVYGIPYQATQKNVWNGQIQRLRNQVVSVFFDKPLTSSFKVFDRKVVLNEHNKLYSKFHFEAIENWMIAPQYKAHLTVNFSPRKTGHSGYSLFKKIKMIYKYGVEYLHAPLKILIYAGILVLMASLFLIVLFFLRKGYVNHKVSYHVLSLTLLHLGVTLVSVGIIANYLASIFLLQKGKPDYLIKEKY